MDEMFTMLLKDMESLAAREELWCAHIYALEYAGFDECHELVIVLPANLPVLDWTRVKEAVEQTAYKHAKEHGVAYSIKENIRKYHEACGHYDLTIGDPVFSSDEYVEVPVKYKWRLNAWDKEVDSNDILVRDADGCWNLACGFGFEGFRA